jgi:Domain of unknown function (DUF4214)
MNSTDHAVLDVEEIVERICARVAARKGIIVEEGRSAADTVRAALRVSCLRTPRLVEGEHYALGDFLVLSDQDFVSAAYHAVLRRQADPNGAQHYLKLLREGSLGKVEVLGRLRYSPEGRRLKVRVKGLAPAFVFAQGCRLASQARALIKRTLRVR